VQYAMLICVDEAQMTTATEAEMQESFEEYEKFMAEMGERGVLQGGARLRPVADATTVRVRDGQTLTADGPFAETKEQLGGFFLVEAADLDEALEIAAKIPGAKHGSIEVRPIWPM
jgi:hypothetical protein